jgi:hypothetical protein
MKKSKRFAIVVNLGTGMLNLSIAHVVVTFWPDQIPNAQGVGIVFSADDGRVTKNPKMALHMQEEVVAFSGEMILLSSLHLSSGVVHVKVDHPLFFELPQSC